MCVLCTLNVRYVSAYVYACFGVHMLHFASVGQTDAVSEDGEHEEYCSTCESVEMTHR